MERRLFLGLLALSSAAAAVSAQVDDAFADDPINVTIDNFTFNPPVIHVAPGGTVRWTNQDDIPHSILCPTLNIHSHALDTGDRFTYRFTEKGTFDYLCGIHPHMRGQVVCG